MPVVFNAGVESQSVQIKITDDSEQELVPEKFSLSLTCENADSVKIAGPAEIEITSDDGKNYI